MTNPLSAIQAFCESCLETHGPNHEGVGWPDGEDAQRRYRVMRELIHTQAPAIADVGCGVGLFYEYLQEDSTLPAFSYRGFDVSEAMLAHARARHPEAAFDALNAAATPLPGSYDYVIANGVFSAKETATQEAMWAHMRNILDHLWQAARIGIAFNVMSKYVDWEKDRLFHVGLTEMGDFLYRHYSRHFVLRHDYGLYEYTAYLYRERRF